MGVKKEWEAHGFRCQVLDSPFSGYNGYVAVSRDHPYHGESYWDFDVSVHGGVTFAKFGNNEERDGEILWPDPELYWIGFDTAHLGDWVGYAPERGGRRWSVEDVAKETEQLAKQLRQIANGEKIKRDITDAEAKELLTKLRNAIKDLEGVKIPLNIINNQIRPLAEWLDREKA